MRSSVTFLLKGEIRTPGFKPLMWKYASEAKLGGWITDSENENDVVMRLEGDDNEIKEFIQSLPVKLYPNFTFQEIQVEKCEEITGEYHPRPFKLLDAGSNPPEIRPDYAPCPDCIREMLDPNSRRYCYPFFSCEHCGAHFSALRRSPFIRRNTCFSSFPPCKTCKSERADEQDHHHHGSELLACPNCGPKLFYVDNSGKVLDDENPVCSARRALAHGEILALQSIYGGFQIFLDAYNRTTFERLRKLKKIPARPIAAMARNIEIVRKYCECSPEEEALLTSKEAPIVVLKLRRDLPENFPADLFCPKGSTLGITLPPTALMHLLFIHEPNENAPHCFDLLATCSNNWEGNYEDLNIDELFFNLSGIADSFLCHDLRIGLSCPSSVAVIREGRPQLLRRARGYTPLPVQVSQLFRRVTAAFGVDAQNAVALGFGNQIVASQELGDISGRNASEILPGTIEHLTMLYDTVPDAAVCDMDSTLKSSEAAALFAEKYSIPLVTVQRHHAHALSCMAESGLKDSLALVFGDGSPGPDGLLWGAELMEAHINSFQRLATFKAAYLPGGRNAVNRPVRQLAGRMTQAGVELSADWLERLHVDEAENQIWRKNCEQQGRFLVSHAATPLFDSVSAALGLAPEFCSYIGETSANLYSAAIQCRLRPEDIAPEIREIFQFNLSVDESLAFIDWSPLFRAIADPKRIREDRIPEYAMAFHMAVADAAVSMAEYGSTRSQVRDIVLSGSTFMNGILSDLTAAKLRARGYQVHLHRMVPPNCSGLAVGQAYHAGILA